MPDIELKIVHKTNKLFLGAQVFLRIATIGTTLASLLVTIYSKQSVSIFGMVLEALFTSADAFKFFAYANAIVCGFSVLSLFFAVVINRRGCNPANHFILFLHDLCMMSLELCGCTAATTIGYIGKYGNKHTSWLPICNQFGRFCNNLTTAVVFGYLGFVFLLVLTVISANRARQIHV